MTTPAEYEDMLATAAQRDENWQHTVARLRGEVEDLRFCVVTLLRGWDAYMDSDNTDDMATAIRSVLDRAPEIASR